MWPWGSVLPAAAWGYASFCCTGNWGQGRAPLKTRTSTWQGGSIPPPSYFLVQQKAAQPQAAAPACNWKNNDHCLMDQSLACWLGSWGSQVRSCRVVPVHRALRLPGRVCWCWGWCRDTDPFLSPAPSLTVAHSWQKGGLRLVTA